MSLIGHDNIVTSVGFSTDGLHLVSGSWDKTVKVWNAIKGDEILDLDLYVFCFAPIDTVQIQKNKY